LLPEQHTGITGLLIRTCIELLLLKRLVSVNIVCDSRI